MRTGSPISPVARPTATLVALAVALSTGPAAAQAPPGETLPTPVYVEGPIPLAVPPTAPPPVLFADPSAVAQPVAPSPAAPGVGDGVTLRDGSILRGNLVEVIHGQRVTVVTATGQRITVPWDQVAELHYVAAPAQPAPSPGPGRPTLHIEVTRPGNVRLFEVADNMLITPSMSWGSHAQAQQAVAICSAPCDRTVDGSRGQSFFIAGNRITPSRRFTLDGHDGPMLARVRPGRVGVLAGGIVFTSLSVAPLLAGTLYLSLSSHMQQSQNGPSPRNAGIAMTAIGAGMLISGIIMIALGRTRVELYRRYTGAAQRRPKPAAAF